jgi:hypothetical protein
MFSCDQHDDCLNIIRQFGKSRFGQMWFGQLTSSHCNEYKSHCCPLQFYLKQKWNWVKSNFTLVTNAHHLVDTRLPLAKAKQLSIEKFKKKLFLKQKKIVLAQPVFQEFVKSKQGNVISSGHLMWWYSCSRYVRTLQSLTKINHFLNEDNDLEKSTAAFKYNCSAFWCLLEIWMTTLKTKT